jgi:hypothetical protein
MVASLPTDSARRCLHRGCWRLVDSKTTGAAPCADVDLGYTGNPVTRPPVAGMPYGSSALGVGAGRGACAITGYSIARLCRRMPNPIHRHRACRWLTAVNHWGFFREMCHNWRTGTRRRPTDTYQHLGFAILMDGPVKPAGREWFARHRSGARRDRAVRGRHGGMSEESALPPDKVSEPRESRHPDTQSLRTPTEAAGLRRSRRLTLSGASAFALYVVVAITGLIVLRAFVDALGFISVGWIIILVFLPLLPWLLPRLGGFLRTISPYVQSFRLGVVQLELRAVRSEPIAVPTSGTLASIPNDSAGLSEGTTISQLMSSLRELRRKGGSPVGVVDLQDGRKWRLPNLYALARLLEMDPVVSELVFTEMRSGSDGYLVGTCRPDELRRQIEHAVPNYSAAASAHPAGLDLADLAQAQQFGTAFPNFLQALMPWSWLDDDPINGYVTIMRMTQLPGLLSGAAVEAPSPTLSEQDLRTVLEAPHRFVPTTAGGRLADLIDRDAVALTVARTALTHI